MKKLVLMTGTAVLLGSTAMTAVAADGHEGHLRADSHGPIGVMGDHQHAKGEWMTSYRYSQMRMEGLRDGTSSVTAAAARASGPYMMAPVDMDMDMHMFGVMYGATDDLTLSVMGSYQEKRMTMENGAAVRSQMKSDGLGDTKISGLYTLYEADGAKLHANLGVSLPTGSIDEKDGAGTALPYGMQLGSGTVDPLLGVTYLAQKDGWSWGAQANAVLRVFDNDNDYHLGNEYNVTPWIARNVSDFASVSVRLDGRYWGGIEGVHGALNTAMLPNDVANSGGQRVDAVVGVNLYQPDGALAGHRLALEVGLPIYQKLDGVQLEVDSKVMLAWQWAF